MAFIDKINPDVPEGRLLIRNGEFILKDPDAEVSKVPLDKKWDKLLKYNNEIYWYNSKDDRESNSTNRIVIIASYLSKMEKNGFTSRFD